MSPERLTGDKYGRDSDLWSVGVMMAECLLGEHPIKYNNYESFSGKRELILLKWFKVYKILIHKLWINCH
jgi:serine/threonine protein kinase